jgi:hypothetical protein
MGTNSLAGLLLFVVVMGAMLWIVWLSWRRTQFGGVSEVSATEQAMLAQDARALYLDPQFKLSNPLAPTDFDRLVLASFDSIEANRDDIDARLEALRVHLKSIPLWDRLKNKQKLRMVYSSLSGSLVRRPPQGQSRIGMQQLFANWRKMGRLADAEGVSRAPETWIRPLVNDSAAAPISGRTNRGILVLSPSGQALVSALFFSVTGAMIISAFHRDLPFTTWLALGPGLFVGIFFATLVGYRVGFIRPYKKPSVDQRKG